MTTIELTAVKTALLIKEECGLQYIFVIPAIAIFSSALFAFLFMPETHGLSLKEIGKIYTEEPMVRSLRMFAFVAIKYIKLKNGSKFFHI